MQRKQILIKSYDAPLRLHKDRATREQEQYKKIVSQSAKYFEALHPNQINKEEVCVNKEAIISCDYKMGK